MSAWIFSGDVFMEFAGANGDERSIHLFQKRVGDILTCLPQTPKPDPIGFVLVRLPQDFMADYGLRNTRLARMASRFCSLRNGTAGSRAAFHADLIWSLRICWTTRSRMRGAAFSSLF